MELVKDLRDKEIRTKVNQAQLDMVKKAAAGRSMTVADFMRYCITQVINQGSGQ